MFWQCILIHCLCGNICVKLRSWLLYLSVVFLTLSLLAIFLCPVLLHLSTLSITVLNFCTPLVLLSHTFCLCRSQWPRGLRHRSAAAHLMRSWVRFPPATWMCVCCECCVLSGRGLCDELITRPEMSYRLWCVVCDLETSRMISVDVTCTSLPTWLLNHYGELSAWYVQAWSKASHHA